MKKNKSIQSQAIKKMPTSITPVNPVTPKTFERQDGIQPKPLDHEMKNGQDIAAIDPKESTEKIAVRVVEDTPRANMHAVRKAPTPPTPQVGIIEPEAIWKLKMTALVADEDRELVAVKAELKAQYLATVTERTNGIQNTYRARRDERIRALIEKEGGEFMAQYQVAPDFSTIHVFPDDMVSTNR